MYQELWVNILEIVFPHSLEDENTNLLSSRMFLPNHSVILVQPVLRFFWALGWYQNQHQKHDRNLGEERRSTDSCGSAPVINRHFSL